MTTTADATTTAPAAKKKPARGALAEGLKVDGVPLLALPPLPRGEHGSLKVSAIRPNAEQHRKFFDPAEGAELEASIKQHGLLQSIAVRELLEGERTAGGPTHEIILGERRWRAHVALELDEIDCKIYKGVTRAQGKAAALVENLQRANINPIEEAEGYHDLMEAEGLTQERCAERVNRSRPVIANALRVLALPEKVVDLIRQRKLTMAHGTALARFAAWPKAVEIMAAQAVKDHTPAGALEKGVPFYHELDGVTVIRHYDTGAEFLDAETKKHPAYFADKENYGTTWVCFDPKHWASHVEAQKTLAAEREAEKAKKQEEALAKTLKVGGKLRDKSDLKHDSYREFKNEKEVLLALVPEASKSLVKDYNDKTVAVVTDTKLADRLSAALKRETKKDRDARATVLAADVRAWLGKLKKLGAREWSYLFAELFTSAGHGVTKRFDEEAAERAGVKVPPALVDDWETDSDQLKELAALAKLDPVDSFKVVVEERLPVAVERLVEHGPEEMSVAFFLWWLEADNFGLLEETEKGRAELLNRVRAAKWYQAEIVAGQATLAGVETDAEITLDPKTLAEWVKAEVGGMSHAEIARTWKRPLADVTGALAGREVKSAPAGKVAKKAALDAAAAGNGITKPGDFARGPKPTGKAAKKTKAAKKK